MTSAAGLQPFRWLGLWEQMMGGGSLRVIASKTWHGEVDFAVLADMLPALVFVTDATGGNLYTNARFQQYTGCSSSELLGDGWLSVMHSDDRARAHSTWAQALAEAQGYEAEYRMRAADGSYRWHLARASAVHENGHVVRWVGSCTDIDDSKRAKVLADQILAASPDVILTLSLSGDLLAINAGGLSAQELALAEQRIGSRWSELWRDTGHFFAAQSAVATAARGGKGRFTGYLVTSEGEPKWADVVVTPIRDAHGTPEKLLVVSRDVTAWREAEAKLKRSRVLIDALLEHAPAVIYAHDAEGRYQLLNRGWEQVSGHDRRQVLGRTISELWSPEAAAAFEADNDTIFAAGGTVEAEEWVDTPAGWRLFHTVKFPLRNEHQRVDTLCAMSVDITARAEAEARLAESEERFRALIEASAEVVWTSDASGTASDPSPSWCAFTGQSLAECAGWGWQEAVHPSDRERVAEQWREVLATRTAYEGEYRLRHHSGGYRWVHGRAAPVIDADGTLKGWVGMNADITARKAAEAELAEREERLRLALAAGGVGTWTLDLASEAISFDELAGTICGWPSASELNVTLFRQLVHPEDRTVFDAASAAIRAGDRRLDVELRIRRASDNVLRWVRLHGAVLARQPGVPARLIGITADISARKTHEEREKLVTREVDHRAKNLLTLAQSVVHLTQAGDVAGFKHIVSGRMAALARAHSLLAAARWEGADLLRLVSEELEPFLIDGDRVAISGPALQLRPQAAQSLALVLHELATNAAKYGALSVESGRLSVSWQLEDEAQQLKLSWREAGGPRVTAPAASGFGSTLVEISIERQLKGKLLRDWQPDGLTCTLSIPAAQISEV